MNKLDESLKELRRQLRENEKLTKSKWDEYAHRNELFSSTTLIANIEVETFEDLKKKIQNSREEKQLTKEIEKARKRLHNSIEKNGLNSTETRKISLEIDALINIYYSKELRNKTKGRFYSHGNFMGEIYTNSFENLRNLTVDLGEFPTLKIWNEYAKKNICLSVQSIEYISRL